MNIESGGYGGFGEGKALGDMGGRRGRRTLCSSIKRLFWGNIL